MERKESILIYASYIDNIQLLTMEQRGVLFTALLEYARGNQQPPTDPMVAMAYSFITIQFERDYKKYVQKVERLRDNAKLGGAPVGNSNAKKFRELIEKQPKQPNRTENNQIVPKTNESERKQENRSEKQHEYEYEYEYEYEDEKVNNIKEDTKVDNVIDISTTQQVTIEKEKEITNNKLFVKEKEKNPCEILPQPKVAIKTKSERANEFKLKLLDPSKGYLQKYGVEMLKDFFNYWTESNESGVRLRYEMERVFDISRRLATWNKNNYNKYNNANNRTTYQTAAERERDALGQFAAKIQAKYETV